MLAFFRYIGIFFPSNAHTTTSCGRWQCAFMAPSAIGDKEIE